MRYSIISHIEIILHRSYLVYCINLYSTLFVVLYGVVIFQVMIMKYIFKKNNEGIAVYMDKTKKYSGSKGKTTFDGIKFDPNTQCCWNNFANLIFLSRE